MIQFKTILCPYDFSEYAEEAVKYAVKLSDSFTQVVLLNIVQLPYFIDPNGFVYFDTKADELKADSEKAITTKLKELQAQYVQCNFDSKLDVNNDPAIAILDAQKSTSADLIVLGSHGRKGLSRLLMGSVAETVMRDAPCPVLIIKKSKQA